MNFVSFCFLPFFSFFGFGCPQPQKMITAWVHQNDYEKALTSLDQNERLIEEVAPAWYLLGENGEVEKREGIRVTDFRMKIISSIRRVRLLPLLMNVGPQGSDPERVRLLFRDPELRHRHVEQVERLVLEEGFAGIDLDYEGLSAREMDPLSILVEEMAKMLHSHDRILSVSLETQASSNALPGWVRIGAAADQVRLMTYGLEIREPGPLVPLDWMDARLSKLLEVVPIDKVVHGLPVYCLAWRGASVRSGTWESLMGSAVEAGIPINRDEATDTPWYVRDGEVVWCEDSLSIKKKMQLSWRMGVRRFAFWRLGGEDPSVWPMITNFLEEKRKGE